MEGRRFLWIDEPTELSRRVRAGEIVVTPVGQHGPIRVSKGLIHDWIGAALFPNATLEDIFAVVQDYTRYKDFYKPLVIDSKSLGADGADHRFSRLVLNKSQFAKSALISEWKDRYAGRDSCYSIFIKAPLPGGTRSAPQRISRTA